MSPCKHGHCSTLKKKSIVHKANIDMRIYYTNFNLASLINSLEKTYCIHSHTLFVFVLPSAVL